MAKVLMEQVEVEESEERKEWQCPKCGATLVDVKPPEPGADCVVCVAVRARKLTPSALYPLGQELGVRVTSGS